jgi:hypothetical protein
VCAEASAVLRAVAADFFSCCYLEIPSDNHIEHVRRFVHYHAQNFYVGSGSRTLELYSVDPDWFECSFIYKMLLVEILTVRVTNIFW